MHHVNIIVLTAGRTDTLTDFRVSSLFEYTKIGEDEIPSERVGYVPDPLLNPIEHTNADTIPISNR